MNDTKKIDHGQEGEYREFIGKWVGTHYSGDRAGNDVYCANCNKWNTVEGTNILFSVCGNCKHCGTSFLKTDFKIGDKFTSPETGDKIFIVKKVDKNYVDANDPRSRSGETSFLKSYITKV